MTDMQTPVTEALLLTINELNFKRSQVASYLIDLKSTQVSEQCGFQFNGGK
jgi:hypothetical protein